MVFQSDGGSAVHKQPETTKIEFPLEAIYTFLLFFHSTKFRFMGPFLHLYTFGPSNSCLIGGNYYNPTQCVYDKDHINSQFRFADGAGQPAQ